MKRKIILALTVTVWALCVQPAELSAQRDSRERALAALGDLSASFEALSEQVNPSVVQILATGYAPVQQGSQPGAGLLQLRRVGGSGVIVDPDGYIVTNFHVVEGANRIRVRIPIPTDELSDRQSVLKPTGKTVGAQVVGVDRETDIAVLRVSERGLPYLGFGESEELRKGQLVFAFGSPLGLENSVSMGVVSAVARQVRPDDPMIYIQTDAPINPGSSGGPLVDSKGLVVGINTFIISQSGGSEGLGFAAPSNIVSNVFKQIKATGYVHRGIVGVNAQTITPALAAGIGLSRDWGVILGDVFPNGPAEQAGLRIGDVLMTMNGKVMENGRQFDVNLYGHPVGEAVTLDVLRGAEELTFRVPVIERPDAFSRFSVMVTPDENLVRRLGILAVDLDQSTAKLLPFLRGESGVVVAARSPEATTGRVELAPGDVIHALNGRPITGLAQLRSAIDGFLPGDPVVLQIERRGQFMYLAFEIE